MMRPGKIEGKRGPLLLAAAPDLLFPPGGRLFLITYALKQGPLPAPVWPVTHYISISTISAEQVLSQTLALASLAKTR